MALFMFMGFKQNQTPRRLHDIVCRTRRQHRNLYKERPSYNPAGRHICGEAWAPVRMLLPKIWWYVRSENWGRKLTYVAFIRHNILTRQNHACGCFSLHRFIIYYISRHQWHGSRERTVPIPIPKVWHYPLDCLGLNNVTTVAPQGDTVRP